MDTPRRWTFEHVAGQFDNVENKRVVVFAYDFLCTQLQYMGNASGAGERSWAVRLPFRAVRRGEGHDLESRVALQHLDELVADRVRAAENAHSKLARHDNLRHVPSG
jgi:hypothetical protein